MSTVEVVNQWLVAETTNASNVVELFEVGVVVEVSNPTPVVELGGTGGGVAAHEAASNPHPQYRLPVGSVFLTAGDANPETLLGYGTWTKRATGSVLSGG